MFGFSVSKRIRIVAVFITACCATGAAQAKTFTVSGFVEETSRAANAPFMFPSGLDPVMHGNFPPRPTLGDSPPHPVWPTPLTGGGGGSGGDDPILPDFGVETTFGELDFNTLGRPGELQPQVPFDTQPGGMVITSQAVGDGAVPGPGAFPLIAIAALMRRTRRRRA